MWNLVQLGPVGSGDKHGRDPPEWPGIGGLGPGLLATVISAVTIDYMVDRAIFPWASPQDYDLPQILRISLFILVALVINLVNETRQRVLTGERAARAEAEDASRLRDQFLAMVSHELRTPLNALLGWSRMLKVYENDKAVSDRARTAIEHNVQSLAHLINDLLDASRILTGQLHLEPQPVLIAELLERSITALEPDIAAKGLILEKHLGSEPWTVSGDPNRLKQVFTNVLTNAVKFTPDGGRIYAGVGRVVNSRIEVVIRDTGIGISKEFLPHVFDRFRQSERTSKTMKTGLGLGMSIARDILEVHGGSIRAYSAGEGKGATFVIELPLSDEAVAVPMPPAEAASDVAASTPEASLKATGEPR